MSWNYRIVKYKNEDAYGLHEVFYNEAGDAWGMTDKPVGFVGETPEELKSTIVKMALSAFDRPVFIEPEVWASSETSISGPYHTIEELAEALDVDEITQPSDPASQTRDHPDTSAA
jgi:hypothetical protein